jgi:AcrR family transcriptional regulator
MARRAGVSSEETRQNLLRAAARLFALKGYDGASITDIASEAGLSTGAIYAHYASKAELFVGTVQAHAQREASELVGLADLNDLVERPVTEVGMEAFVTAVTMSLANQGTGDATLLLEAIVAGKRHPDVAQLIASWVGEGEDVVAQSIRQGQEGGLLDGGFDAEAAARFVTILSLGARLAGALDMPPVDVQAWTRFLLQLVSAVRVVGDPE